MMKPTGAGSPAAPKRGRAPLVLLIAVASVAYDIPFPRDLVGYVAAFLLGMTSLFAIGLLLAAVAPSARAATSIAIPLFFAVMFLGGVYMPRALLPEIVQRIGEFIVVPNERVRGGGIQVHGADDGAGGVEEGQGEAALDPGGGAGLGVEEPTVLVEQVVRSDVDGGVLMGGADARSAVEVLHRIQAGDRVTGRDQGQR